MADENRPAVRHDGPRHPGPAHSSPYPTSRLAPAHDLVDTARQIAEADHMIGAVVHGKLEVIAEQIRSLQAQAREILGRARVDANLHRAQCRFQKRAGHTYHLYRREDETSYLSLLSPVEWRRPTPHEYVGSYRLEADMSWTSADTPTRPATAQLAALAGIDDFGPTPG